MAAEPKDWCKHCLVCCLMLSTGVLITATRWELVWGKAVSPAVRCLEQCTRSPKFWLCMLKSITVCFALDKRHIA